tara:strand:- start:2026 stop:2577 length:552 start_codon:yes stop_codon:yes gene_type:complete
MNSVFANYFQKSKVFLYPLIDMKKNYKYTPIETYVRWQNIYKLSDKKLICEYKVRPSKRFNTFEKKYIRGNPYLDDIIYLSQSKMVCIYDMSKFEEEFIYFIKGEYSKFKHGYKEKVLDFYREDGKKNKYVDSYLFPEAYHKMYAKELDVDLSLIENTFELCNKPDLEKETFYGVKPDKIIYI